MPDSILHLLDAVTSRWSEALALFLIPFLHEDVAIVTGSLLIVEHRMPMQLALASLYLGMVASDFLLYGLGRAARRSPRVRRMLLRPGVDRISGWLKGNAAAVIVVARLIPGLMFPVYVGCGLARVRVAVFAATTMLTAAVYLPALLWVVNRFGEGLLSRIGYWAWIAALGLLMAMAFMWVRSPHWDLLLRVSRSGLGGLLRGARTVLERNGASHKGMPALRGLRTRIALAERIPPILFYTPLWAQWMWLAIRYRSLSLPALANPQIEIGGLWGESKVACLDMVAGGERRWLARYAGLRRGRGGEAGEQDARRAAILAADAGFSYPLVAKPDIGWRGFGVRLVACEAALRAYVSDFPPGAAMLVQEAIACEGEAGVLYARRPGEATGKVISLTFRYFPHVTGDGERTLRDLILADQRASWKAGTHLGFAHEHSGLRSEELDRVPAPGETVRLAFIGSNRVGGLYRDAWAHITPELSARFDAISRSIPEFHYGRYDIRFDSVERLRRGEGFRIIEINGAGGESINVWDPEMPLREVYAELFEQQRLLFEIGDCNRARGFRPPGPLAVLGAAWRQTRLIRKYPPSS